MPGRVLLSDRCLSSELPSFWALLSRGGGGIAAGCAAAGGAGLRLGVSRRNARSAPGSDGSGLDLFSFFFFSSSSSLLFSSSLPLVFFLFLSPFPLPPFLPLSSLSPAFLFYSLPNTHQPQGKLLHYFLPPPGPTGGIRTSRAPPSPSSAPPCPAQPSSPLPPLRCSRTSGHQEEGQILPPPPPEL